jgi:hypothetical protein
MNLRFLLATVCVVAAPATLSSQPAASAPARAAAAPAAAMTAEFVALDAPEAAEIRAIGERAISRIAYSLVSEVTVAVGKQGAAAALVECHLKYIPISGRVIEDMPRITALKRTSLRLRNPANAPDAADELALRKVARELDAGNPPRLVLQRVQLAGGANEWRVYRPLAVTTACLACHGTTESIADDVRAELKWRFPNDAATGYSTGEWRGLIRVSVADAPATPATPKLPSARKS